MSKCWVVYVGEKAAVNFSIGFSRRVWGHKIIFKTTNIAKIKKGDTLYFIQHLQKLKEPYGNNIHNGFPRVSVEKLYGVIKSLSKCIVTSNYYEEHSKIWNDDIYPHRYNFNILEQHHDINFGLEFFDKAFVEAVRESLLTKGSPIEVKKKFSDGIFNEVNSLGLEVEEGNPIYRTHLQRERKSEIVTKKKEEVLKSKGFLSCEACGFNFTHIYGKRGKNYIECHHKNPLADTNVGVKTKLDDLALLCANCHRMIHRYKIWITVEELISIIRNKNECLD